MKNEIKLIEVTAENWRDVTQLNVSTEQKQYVADPSYYLLLCHYGKVWHPIAIQLNQQIIGFMMWAVDPDDNSGWIGGFLIDSNWQGKGFGKQAVQAILTYFQNTLHINHFALSVQPENPALHLYEKIGFVKTEEWEDNEIVMRFNP